MCVCVCSGPRCVARFDFESEHSDELPFTEGQVIRLVEYVGEDWARGEIGGHVGIFPLNFVEVLEDLPPPPAKTQSRVPLPGTTTFFSNSNSDSLPNNLPNSADQFWILIGQKVKVWVTVYNRSSDSSADPNTSNMLYGFSGNSSFRMG